YYHLVWCRNELSESDCLKGRIAEKTTVADWKERLLLAGRSEQEIENLQVKIRKNVFKNDFLLFGQFLEGFKSAKIGLANLRDQMLRQDYQQSASYEIATLMQAYVNDAINDLNDAYE